MTPFEAKGWTKEDRFRWSDTAGEWRIEDDDASVAPWFRSASGRGAYIDLSQLTKIEDDAMSDGATEMLRDEGQYAQDNSVQLEQADEPEWIDARMEQVDNYNSGDNEGVNLPSPYHRLINGAVIDVYDILHAYREAIGNPALEHAIKKALVPGGRGQKSREQDLREIQWSVERAIDLEAD
jgi:hypothetical protein